MLSLGSYDSRAGSGCGLRARAGRSVDGGAVAGRRPKTHAAKEASARLEGELAGGRAKSWGVGSRGRGKIPFLSRQADAGVVTVAVGARLLPFAPDCGLANGQARKL
jgi:hypothetical protein